MAPEKSLTIWRAWLAGGLLGLPSIIFLASGIVHLQNGMAVNGAFPVPLNISANKMLPRAAYVDAVEILSHANNHDGNVQISLAEARVLAGENKNGVLSQLEDGLARAPASAEGWAFYAETLESSDPHKAAQALDQAYTLAPYEFFWAGRRAQLAAHIWNYLSDDTKNVALRQTRTLWDEPMLRDELVRLRATSDGVQLINRAYADNVDTRRVINRWISARRRQLQISKS